jgi:hypothetical protein
MLYSTMLYIPLPIWFGKQISTSNNELASPAALKSIAASQIFLIAAAQAQACS